MIKNLKLILMMALVRKNFRSLLTGNAVKKTHLESSI
jgi:hypothetical protein